MTTTTAVAPVSRRTTIPARVGLVLGGIVWAFVVAVLVLLPGRRSSS
jgi:hypothetical protein